MEDDRQSSTDQMRRAFQVLEVVRSAAMMSRPLHHLVDVIGKEQNPGMDWYGSAACKRVHNCLDLIMETMFQEGTAFEADLKKICERAYDIHVDGSYNSRGLEDYHEANEATGLYDQLGDHTLSESSREFANRLIDGSEDIGNLGAKR